MTIDQLNERIQKEVKFNTIASETKNGLDTENRKFKMRDRTFHVSASQFEKTKILQTLFCLGIARNSVMLSLLKR